MSEDGARWVKYREGDWVILPEVLIGGRSVRWGGSLKAIELAFGFDAAELLMEQAEEAKRRGEESVEWPE